MRERSGVREKRRRKNVENQKKKKKVGKKLNMGSREEVAKKERWGRWREKEGRGDGGEGTD